MTTKKLCFFSRQQSTLRSALPHGDARRSRCSAVRTLLLKVLNTATQELKIVTVISQRVKRTILKYHLLSHLKAVGYVFFPLYLYIQSSDLEKPIQ